MDEKVSNTYPTYGLRAVAWVDLIASIISAIVLWATSTYAVTNTTLGIQIGHTEINFFRVGLGIGILFQGIFVCKLFLIIASIPDHLAFTM